MKETEGIVIVQQEESDELSCRGRNKIDVGENKAWEREVLVLISDYDKLRGEMIKCHEYVSP